MPSRRKVKKLVAPLIAPSINPTYVNLSFSIEMKFYTGAFAIDKTYTAELERKLRVFREQSKRRKALFLTFITTYGVKKNEYAYRLVHNNLTMDIFFD